MDQRAHRRVLKAAQTRWLRADKDRRAAALHAAAQGVPVTNVADALDVNRVTVHRWIRTDKERPGAVDAARGTDTHQEAPDERRTEG